ncbi:MAG: DNA replication/repair protein RecF [Methylococcales bacterium]|jgi:DNA replication and repair protein RecF|nr:DNA replication/repair protein RecF [Methylococcales bacterium]
MGLLTLDVFNVRNINKASIEPAPKFNFIYGLNGSGKSALLEAVFLMGRAKSFRTADLSKIINFNANQFIVSGKIQTQKNTTTLGIQYHSGQLVARMDQQTVKSKASIAYCFPLQIIHPKSYRTLDAGPQIRREFMDWGVFNLDPVFLTSWRRFKTALTQRNAALKNKLLNEVRVWEPELAYYGTIVQECRCNYIEQLKPYFLLVSEQLLGITEIDIKINAGWDASFTYEQVLHKSIEKDLRHGYTRLGPHRGDLSVLVQKRQAKDLASRGQLKMLVLALSMAQVLMMKESNQQLGCFMIDDLTAELDQRSKEKVFRCLDDMSVQVFLTATDQESFKNDLPRGNHKMFHVEQGVITEA